MNKILDKLKPDARDKLVEKKFPRWVDPMLAKLTHDYFDDPDWIYERKFDGERCITYIHNGEVRLKSRNEKKLNAQYPELADAFGNMNLQNMIIDGEIVAFKEDVTSFKRLQKRMHVSDVTDKLIKEVPVYYYLFDIIYFDGYDLSKLPLRDRKRILKECIDYEDPIRFTIHRDEKGLEFHNEACKKGWEGLIAKDADSQYKHKRSSKWLKFKCIHQQEFVIGGYTEPSGERIGFGALLIGYYDGDDLVYAGKVGTGYDDDMLRMLSDRMSDIERKTSPFDRGEVGDKSAHFIQPKLVGEVGFTEWTKDNKLRHPRFLGLREDKKPENVRREDKSQK